MKLFLKTFVFLCSMVCVLAAAPSITSKSVTLSSLPALMDALLKAAPEKKKLDGPMMMEAHRRFVKLLDPEKSYFLEAEIAPFLDPAKQNAYVWEVANGSFQSYRDVGGLFQKAVQRSKSIRKRLQGRFFPKREGVVKDFPKNIEELEGKIFLLFLASPQERGGAVPKKTVAELERHEDEWSMYNEELIAQTILKSILSSLDVNSDVMARRDARNMREKLTKEASGTGIVCENVQNSMRIAHIQKGSPAEEIGVFQKGDILLAIDRKPCPEMSLEEVDELLREKETGFVAVAWERPGWGAFEKSIPLRSFIIEDGRVRGKMHRNKLIITVPSLYTNGRGVSTTEDMEKIIEDALQKNHVSGLLLDLRGNGGGYLTEAVSICGLFIKTGVIMTAVYADGQKAVYRDTDPRVFFDGPIVVLTSEWTASAAEIVAQTLKDYGRAIIVGPERTFGKGSIQMQTVTDVKAPADMPLKYTVGKFYSVAGISPNGKGVEADIVLPGFPNKRAHGISAASLPEAVSPEFHDTLKDINGSARQKYRRQYIPYLQEKEDKYRKFIPLLRERSEERTKKLLPQSLLQFRTETPAEKQARLEQISKAHLRESENILEDLIEKM